MHVAFCILICVIWLKADRPFWPTKLMLLFTSLTSFIKFKFIWTASVSCDVYWRTIFELGPVISRIPDHHRGNKRTKKSCKGCMKLIYYNRYWLTLLKPVTNSKFCSIFFVKLSNVVIVVGFWQLWKFWKKN